MTDWTGKTYWLIGASEGLGRALAHQLSRVGVELVLSARSAGRLDEIVQELPGKARALAVDVTSDKAVADAAEEAGDIDGVIYCAGVYWPQGARDWNAEQVAQMCDVNFTGAARVLGATVPRMVARDRGHILLLGSLSGFRGLPGSIGYSSSKAALMHLAESMHADLRGTGVRVQLANPGFIRTRLTEKNDFSMPQIMEAEDAARAIFEHMDSGGFKRNFPAPFSWLFRASQFLPDWLYYPLFGRGG